MRSPFAGMEPYLESPAIWEEFHHVFITECMYFLSDRLPANYLARIVERVELVSRDDEAASQYVPDVSVIRKRDAQKPVVSSDATAIAVAEPITIPSLDSIEVREGYIEIVRLPDHKLVTSIELLSPCTKFGEGIGEFRHKRRSLVRNGVHVVELDLLRRGKRTELSQPLPPGDYFALVFRADRRPDVQVYAWLLRDPSKPISIPLQATDAPVSLDLPTVVATTYERGRFDRKVRYDVAPPGPISEQDAAWAKALAETISQH